MNPSILPSKWKHSLGFPSNFIHHPGLSHVVSVSPRVNNRSHQVKDHNLGWTDPSLVPCKWKQGLDSHPTSSAPQSPTYCFSSTFVSNRNRQVNNHALGGRTPLKSRSHQSVRPVLVMELLGIVLRNKCWPTTFHTITVGDVDGWCQNWPVWSTPHWYPTDESRCGFSYDFIHHSGLPLIISVSYFSSSRNHQIKDHALDEWIPSLVPLQMKVRFTLSSTT